MLTPTLEEGLAAYSIGEKLRALRLRKKMGLAELSAHTELSPALLSKLERGRIFPTLPTLLRIAMVFSVGLDYFFRDDDDRQRLAIVRRAERQSFPDDPSGEAVSYYFESLDFAAVERKLNAYMATFEPIGLERARPHAHDGAEFIYVLGGQLALHVGDEDATLEAGDAVYFDSSRPHSYRRVGVEPCTALVVTAG
jgi:transcriptional regulator with XRE-family HTH domain